KGMVEYAAPQICDRAVPFCSRLREIIRGRSEELEALAVEMYARGLSTRDIEALFADERGQLLLSRTAVSEITQRLWAEYEAFAKMTPPAGKGRTNDLLPLRQIRPRVRLQMCCCHNSLSWLQKRSCSFFPLSKQETFPDSVFIHEFNAGSLQSGLDRIY